MLGLREDQQSSIDYPGYRRAARWNRGTNAVFVKFGCSHSLSKEIDSGSQKKGIIDLSTVSRVLGRIYSGRGEEGKTIHHPEKALGIATNFEWPTQLSQTSSSLAWLSFSPRRRRVQRRCPRPHFAGQDARSIMRIAMVTISGRASAELSIGCWAEVGLSLADWIPAVSPSQRYSVPL